MLLKMKDVGIMTTNGPFEARPSRDRIFIKLWADLKNARNGKTIAKISKWQSLRPLALKNEIL